MAENCLKCKESLEQKGHSKYGRICRSCVAEFILAGEEKEINAFIRMQEGIAPGMAGPFSREGLQRQIRAAACERCGVELNYDHNVRQGGVWCDDCGKNCCQDCSKRVIVAFETAGGETIDQNADRFLCKNCIAARVLGNWKVKYVVTGPDGKETLQETAP